MADTGLSKLYESRNQYSFWEFVDDQIHSLYDQDPGPDIGYDDNGDIGADELIGNRPHDPVGESCPTHVDGKSYPQRPWQLL